MARNRPGDVPFTKLHFNNTRNKRVIVTVTPVSLSDGNPPTPTTLASVTKTVWPKGSFPHPEMGNDLWKHLGWSNIVSMTLLFQDPMNPLFPDPPANPNVTLGTLPVAMPSPAPGDPQTYPTQATINIADWAGPSTPTCNITLQDSSPTPVALATKSAVVSDGVVSGFGAISITNNMRNTVTVVATGTTNRGTVVPEQTIHVSAGGTVNYQVPVTWVDIIEVSLNVRDTGVNDAYLGVIDASTPSELTPGSTNPQPVAISASLTLSPYPADPQTQPPNATLCLHDMLSPNAPGETALAYIPEPNPPST